VGDPKIRFHSFTGAMHDSAFASASLLRHASKSQSRVIVFDNAYVTNPDFIEATNMAPLRRGKSSLNGTRLFLQVL